MATNKNRNQKKSKSLNSERETNRTARKVSAPSDARKAVPPRAPSTSIMPTAETNNAPAPAKPETTSASLRAPEATVPQAARQPADDPWALPTRARNEATGDVIRLTNDGPTDFAVLIGSKPVHADTAYDHGERRLATPDDARRGLKVSTRTLVPVMEFGLRGNCVGVIDLPARTYRELAALRFDHPFEGTCFSITRTGEREQTRYTVRVLRPQTRAEREAIRRVAPLDTKAIGMALWDRTPPPPVPTASAPASAAPAPMIAATPGLIAPAHLSEIEALIANLPPGVRGEIEETFGVQSLAAISADQAIFALRLARALASQHASNTPSTKPPRRNI